MLLDVGGDCIVIERGARSCPRRLRLRRRAETRNLLGIARDIRANTLVSLSRVNPRTSQLAQPFKGRSRPKVSPSLFRILLFEANLQTDLQIEMKFKLICAIEREKKCFPIYLDVYFFDLWANKYK